MSNVIGRNHDYDGKGTPSGSRPIKTSVKLFGNKRDIFSHSAPVRHAKISARPSDYEDLAGGHKNERE